MILGFAPFLAVIEQSFWAPGTWWSLGGLNRRMVLFVATFINFLLLILPYSLYERGYWLLRDWLYVEDNCHAIDLVLRKGTPGDIYNVRGGNELSNIDLIHLLLHALAQQTGKPEEDYTKLITFVPDRLGHDRRYALDSSKLCCSLGWAADSPVVESLVQSVSWLRGAW
jgi:dTDP-glucose 4,6-dehydratase